MSKFKSFLLLNFLLALLVFVVIGAMQAYAFSDDFNTGDLSQWTIPDPWSISNINGWDGTNFTTTVPSIYVYNYGSGSDTHTMYATITGENSYFQAYMKTAMVSGCLYDNVARASFRFNSNATNYLEVNLYETSITQSGMPDVTGLTANTWYKVDETISGSNVRRQVYNMNGTLLGDSTVTFTPINNANRVTLVGYVGTRTGISPCTAYANASFDNIIAQTYTPGSTPSIISWGNSITNNQNTTIYIP